MLSIPNGFMPFVSDQLEALTDDWRWEQDGTLTPAQCAVLMRTMVDDYYASICVTPGGQSVVPLPVYKPAAVSSSWLEVIDARMVSNGYSHWAAAVSQSWAYWDVFLSPGTWSFLCVGNSRSSNGIMNIAVSGVGGVQTDWYSAAVGLNSIRELGAFVIPDSTMRRVTLTMFSKNGSSTGYDAWMSEMYMKRVA